ncbi:MAG: potassium-transporting ATPase subunit KdpA, partial [Bacteroidetes bacterium]|nr:potassium-transporting ATPase subunit KdpA [Bacteroidota bacterium]
VFSKIESAFYRLVRIDSGYQMDWKEYAVQLLIFNLLGFLVLFIIQIVQQSLPINPQHLPNVDLLLALNTAVSFTTNTNWQSYAGETTLSYFVQMIGMTVQNFLSAATGIAVMITLIRGIATRNGKYLGNFWVDITRAVLYVLLPLSFLLSIILISQGVVQTFNHSVTATTLEGISQTIPLGPAASQISIKQLGTNGGGFFNTNSAFPFENPTPLSNFLQVLSILLIPASLVFTYGKMLGSKKHAWTIFGVMLSVFLIGVVISYLSETANNPIFHTNQLMEGKETRFGIFNSVLWSVATTVASNGSVNSMISSMSPVSGLVAMLNIQLGEIIFGGVGSGLYGMFLFIVITVFISGLMVGRTPEYFGKKIEAYEIKFSILAVLLPSIIILVFTAVAVISNTGLSSLSNKGPHGLSEILYAFTSAGGNNGSAFAGLNTSTNFYNVLMSIAMIIGRYGVIVPILAIAGSLVKKNIAPATTGTLATDNFLFAFLLFGVIIIVGALTFFPVLSIGPLLEHLLMNLKITF